MHTPEEEIRNALLEYFKEEDIPEKLVTRLAEIAFEAYDEGFDSGYWESDKSE